MDHVFAHFPCNDGELSYLIWEYFKPKSKFYMWKHNDNMNEINIINNLPDNSNIVFLDLTPPLTKLKNTHTYLVIDHHKEPLLDLLNSGLEKTYKLTIYKQDGFPNRNDMSGCMLTWNYLIDNQKKYTYKYNYPSVIYYVGNKDVWNFKDINTEPYCIGYNMEINKYKGDERKKCIKYLIENEMDNIFIKNGNDKINEYKKMAKNYFNLITIYSETDVYGSYNMILVSCKENYMYKYLIDYAIEHYKLFDVLCIKYETGYSLRRLRDNIRVDGIARKYNGNGHEGAAGYASVIASK